MKGMISRRGLVLTGLLIATEAPLARAEPVTSDDPVAIVTAIYTRAAKGKGDGGGAFVIENKTAKAKYLSKSLATLWAKADAHTPKGDVGPVDFDPVTNSQESDVKSFKVETEKLDASRALIAVTIAGPQHPIAQAGGSGYPLRLRARDGRLEDRRHQGLKRRRSMVDPDHAFRLPETMRQSMDDIVDNKAQQRYELVVDGHLAAAFYKRDGDVITFIHTEVPPELGGRGVGSKLVQGALDQVRSAGESVIAECPFVKAWIGKHFEYKGLLKA